MSISPGTGLTFLLGGARSGKSDLAVELGRRWPGTVVFAATAEAGDDDMAARIARHRADRPDRWVLVEQPLLAASDVAAVDAEALLIVDCLTLLVANLLFADRTDDETADHIADLGDRLADRAGPSVVVSNEVGMGVHPETELGRRYRDLLGRTNRVLTDRAETALLVVAGRVLPLEPLSWPW